MLPTRCPSSPLDARRSLLGSQASVAAIAAMAVLGPIVVETSGSRLRDRLATDVPIGAAGLVTGAVLSLIVAAGVTRLGWQR